VSVSNIDTSSIGQTIPASLRPKPTQPQPAKAAPVTTDAADKKNAGPLDKSDSALTSLDTQSAADSLQDQIRAAREQLNDWVTCVSATTPQGKAEIRSLSTQISAAEEQIDRLPQAAGATAAAASVDLWA
jgi:hypothetical protein